MKKNLLEILRNRDIDSTTFRETVNKLSDIIAKEAFERLKQKLDLSTGFRKDDKICLIPILRSGITLLPAFLKYFYITTIGVLGIKRDEKTYKPSLYYQNIPKIDKDTLLYILDPMIATGGTICLTVEKLIKLGGKENNIIIESIIAAPEGLKKIQDNYRKVTINTISIDKKLNSKKLIVPGLGDFGDRYFGTN